MSDDDKGIFINIVSVQTAVGSYSQSHTPARNDKEMNKGWVEKADVDESGTDGSKKKIKQRSFQPDVRV